MLPFWLGLGGVIGTGKQPLPWIHIDDLCNLIKFSIENNAASGALNGVAPQIITNEDFTKVRQNFTGNSQCNGKYFNRIRFYFISGVCFCFKTTRCHCYP